MSHVVIVGSVGFAPGDRERWMAHVPKMSEATLQEPGCLTYLWAPDPLSESRMLVCEVFEDRAAFDHHGSSDHHVEFLDAIAGIPVADIAIRWYEADEVPPLAGPASTATGS